MFLAARAKAIRVAKNLSTRDVQERSGVSRSYISNVETGSRSNVTHAIAERWARGLGVSVDVLWPVCATLDPALLYVFSDDDLIGEAIRRGLMKEGNDVSRASG